MKIDLAKKKRKLQRLLRTVYEKNKDNQKLAKYLANNYPNEVGNVNAKEPSSPRKSRNYKPEVQLSKKEDEIPVLDKKTRKRLEKKQKKMKKMQKKNAKDIMSRIHRVFAE